MLAEYAPNIPNAIEHRQFLSPLDLERTFGITGGNIMQGAMPLHQLYCFRPVAGWADHRTPVPGLYFAVPRAILAAESWGPAAATRPAKSCGTSRGREEC